MRVIVQYIVPTENTLKRDCPTSECLDLFCSLPLPSSHPLRSPHLPLNAHVMQATLINICCSKQIDVSAATINIFCTERFLLAHIMPAEWTDYHKTTVFAKACNVFSNNY